MMTYINVLAFQGVLLFFVVFIQLSEIGVLNLTLILLETIVFKSLAVPIFLSYLLKRNNITREAEPFLPNFVSLVITTSIVVVNILIATMIEDPNLDKIFFVVALSTLFFGLYIIATRRKIITHVMGYMVIENGVFVLSLAIGNEMPILVNLGIMLDIFASVLILGIFMNKIGDVFKDVDVDQLSNLKDYYLLGSITVVLSLFFSRNKQFVYSLLGIFLAWQSWFTIQASTLQGTTDSVYFTFDSLGILLLVTLTIIAIPAAIHSYIYIENHHEPPKSRSLYLASMILLIMAITAGYLSNHIAVTWIFTEITTLSASALIYHHRNKLALEGTWKYVFICAISITFIFIGILFLSLSLQHAGSDNLSFINLLANSKELNPVWLRMAFLFIFTGFTAKLGLVPMFTAGIDAKDTAPAPAGALMASVLMNLGFVGIFRFYVVVANTPLLHWAQLAFCRFL
jgi:hydrogenase-4 membrane subunit HyfE